MSEKIGIIGIDQYGEAYHDLGKYPRKALLDRLCASKAEKIYRDTKSGGSIHTGYKIRDRWIEIFDLSRWQRGKA